MEFIVRSDEQVNLFKSQYIYRIHDDSPMIVMKKLVWYGRVSMPFYTKKKCYLLNLAERLDLKLSTMVGKDKNVQKTMMLF